MINSATYKLADALAPNFAASADWNKTIFLLWAERILSNRINPPEYLMKIIQTKEYVYGTRNIFSLAEESNILIQIRKEYAEARQAKGGINRYANYVEV